MIFHRNEQFLEQGLVEQPSAVVVQLAVERPWLRQKVELRLHDGRSLGKLGVVPIEAGLHVSSLHLDGGQPGAHLARFKLTLAHDVKQVLLLPVEPGQLSLQLVTQELG